MDENIMKLIDRLIAAERLNMVYESKLKRVSEIVWDAERECVNNQYSYRTDIDDVDITTAQIRKAIGLEPEVATVAAFAEKKRKRDEEEDD